MRVLQPAGWPRPKGYANGIAARGEMLFLAGCVGWDADGRFPGGLVAQFRQALQNIVAILAEGGEQRGLRVGAQGRGGRGNGVAMIGIRIERGFSQRLAGAGDMENDLAPGTIDARQPHAAGGDFKKTHRPVALPEQGFAGLQSAVRGPGAHRRREPVVVGHFHVSPLARQD